MTYSWILFASLSCSFVALLLFCLVQFDRKRRSHTARLRRVGSTGTTQVSVVRRKQSNTANTHGVFLRIDEKLSQTNLRVTVNELLAQISIAVLGLYALSVLQFEMSPLLAIPVALAIPIGVAALVLRIAKARYLTTFTNQLPEALDVFARGLRAGRPVSDSLAIVVENAEGPILREFTRCHSEICMGTTLHESLARLDQRIPTPEVSFFAVATALQAETGGNMIETMENLAEQLRERRKLRKKARALSSEARASAMILASLPFAVALAIGLLNGAYLEPLYGDPRGRIMSGAAIASISLGVFMMARMGKLDV
jgi:tight adherence protein B